MRQLRLQLIDDGSKAWALFGRLAPAAAHQCGKQLARGVDVARQLGALALVDHKVDDVGFHVRPALRIAVPWLLARQNLKQHNAERVDLGRCGVCSTERLRSTVRQRSARGVRLCACGRGGS